jgi:hypothetical protein
MHININPSEPGSDGRFLQLWVGVTALLPYRLANPNSGLCYRTSTWCFSVLSQNILDLELQNDVTKSAGSWWCVVLRTWWIWWIWCERIHLCMTTKLQYFTVWLTVACLSQKCHKMLALPLQRNRNHTASSSRRKLFEIRLYSWHVGLSLWIENSA